MEGASGVSEVLIVLSLQIFVCTWTRKAVFKCNVETRERDVEC